MASIAKRSRAALCAAAAACGLAAPAGAQALMPEVPAAICERVGDDVLIGTRFGGAFTSYLLRRASGDFAADCDPERRPDDRFLGEQSFRCLHSTTSAVIAQSSAEEVGERFVLRRSPAGDEMADCAPAPREGDVVLNDDLARPSYAVRLVGDLFYYETSTGPQGGLTLHDIAAGRTLVDIEEGVGIELTPETFAYYDRLREASEADCPDEFAQLTEGTGAAGLYVWKSLDVATGKTEEFETACLTEQ